MNRDDDFNRGVVAPPRYVQKMKGPRMPVAASDKDEAKRIARGKAWWPRVLNKEVPIHSRGRYWFVLGDE